MIGLQLVFVALVLGFLGYALRDTWRKSLPLLRDTDPLELGIGILILAGYYLLFVVGWRWILSSLGVQVGYGVALQSEMASMLAKYVPGGVWTPLARIVWLRRAANITQTPDVIGSILLEAGLSAVAGVLVFVGGLAWIGGGDAPLLPLGLFAALVAVLVHPRVFAALGRRIFMRFDSEPPAPLPYGTMLGLIAFYSLTWLVGGAALYFLVRAVGGDPGPETIPYLGGTAAVGAIVAVLTVIAPSGLGVREGSMYALMLAIAGEAVSLGATVLNRLAITVVEAALLLLAVLIWRVGRRPAPPAPEPERS